MDICKEIESAKCCVAKFAGGYVRAATFGENTMDMLYELLLLNAYIEALERKDCGSCNNKCLSDEETCFILTQISLKCDSFKCGC